MLFDERLVFDDFPVAVVVFGAVWGGVVLVLWISLKLLRMGDVKEGKGKWRA
jgi:hypothetical protein